MTLILRNGQVVVGTDSGELMLLQGDQILKQIKISYGVLCAIEIDHLLYVGTLFYIEIVDLNTFKSIKQVKTEAFVFDIKRWKE